MSDIHLVFHVSQLRRCLKVPETEHVPIETIDLQPDLRYQEIPVKILDTVTRRTRNSEVQICRVQWSRHGVEEATWEREEALKKEFPHLFRNQPNLEDEIHFKWGRFVTSRKLTKLNHALKLFLSLSSTQTLNPNSQNLSRTTRHPNSIRVPSFPIKRDASRPAAANPAPPFSLSPFSSFPSWPRAHPPRPHSRGDATCGRPRPLAPLARTTPLPFPFPLSFFPIFFFFI